MDKITKATILLDSFNNYQYRMDECYSNLDSDFSPTNEYISSLNKNLENLLKLTYDCFSDDDDFLFRLIKPNEIMSCLNMDNAVCFLKGYLKNTRPAYLDTLLDNANDLRDERLYNCSAYCIRLFAETNLKSKCTDFIDIEKYRTLGALYNHLHEKGKVDDRNYKLNVKNIKRLNSIVHDDQECKDNPPESSELTDLVRWARIFDDEMSKISFE